MTSRTLTCRPSRGRSNCPPPTRRRVRSATSPRVCAEALSPLLGLHRHLHLFGGNQSTYPLLVDRPSLTSEVPCRPPPHRAVGQRRPAATRTFASSASYLWAVESLGGAVLTDDTAGTPLDPPNPPSGSLTAWPSGGPGSPFPPAEPASTSTCPLGLGQPRPEPGGFRLPASRLASSAPDAGQEALAPASLRMICSGVRRRACSRVRSFPIPPYRLDDQTAQALDHYRGLS